MKEENAKQTLASLGIIVFGLLAFAWLVITTAVPAYEMRAIFTRIMAVVYPATVAIIIIVTIGVAIGTVAGSLFLCWTLYNRGLIWHSSARIKLAEATRLAREAHLTITVAPPGHQIIVSEVAGLPIVHKPLHLAAGKVNGAPAVHTDEERQRWVMWQLVHGARGRLAGEELPTLPSGIIEQPLDILIALDSVQCGLIVGQRDSGKTTLLQHLISRRLDKSRVVILDPHSHPTRWPGGCTVIGTGRDFGAIGEALAGLNNLMNKRYREIGKGLVREGQHTRITVIIDEWRTIVFNLGKEAGDMIASLLAESRKINIDVFVGTHSERVKALGIDGEGDLKEGFVMVRLSINKATKERRCTVDYGDGELPAVLPGPYIGLNSQPVDGDEDILELTQSVTQVDPEAQKDAEFVRLVRDEGMSRRKAALRAYHRSYAGDIVERGQRALGEI